MQKVHINKLFYLVLILCSPLFTCGVSRQFILYYHGIGEVRTNRRMYMYIDRKDQKALHDIYSMYDKSGDF